MTPNPIEPNSAQQDECLYYRGILHELIELGTDLAREIHRKAKAPDANPAADPTIAFDRIARCIRRTIVLAQAVMAPPKPPTSTAAKPDQTAARKRVIRAVEDTIQRETEDAESDMLHAEFQDRLETEDFAHDLEHHSVPDLIADICRDLGIAHFHGTHPWKRRTPQDLATLHQRAAETSPFHVGNTLISLHPSRFRGK